jgi:hypothetical protein
MNTDTVKTAALHILGEQELYMRVISLLYDREKLRERNLFKNGVKKTLPKPDNVVTPQIQFLSVLCLIITRPEYLVTAIKDDITQAPTPIITTSNKSYLKISNSI